jgi:rhodanese-related sulfurtransferase
MPLGVLPQIAYLYSMSYLRPLSRPSVFSIFYLLFSIALLAADPVAQPSYKEVSVPEAQTLIKEKKVVVLDVRTPKEFAEGHIAGATNVNFQAADFAKKLESLDRSKSYLVHCAAGGRSAKTREQMKKLNFKSVYHLTDGFKGWEKAGQPIAK